MGSQELTGMFEEAAQRTQRRVNEAAGRLRHLLYTDYEDIEGEPGSGLTTQAEIEALRADLTFYSEGNLRLALTLPEDLPVLLGKPKDE